MKADWSAAWAHSLEGGSVAIKGCAEGSANRGQEGERRIPSITMHMCSHLKGPPDAFSTQQLPCTAKIAETVLRALAVS